LRQAKRFGIPVVAQNPELNKTDEKSIQAVDLRDPFACPQCGQMLAPTCRVCVACGHAIELSEIIRSQGRFDGQPPSEVPRSAARGSQFSWAIFFGTLAGAMLIISVAVRFIGVESSKLAFVGFTLICAGWVFYDARSRRIPHGWRWSIMTVFFWIVFFPWYLSRRRRPLVACRPMEDQRSVIFRALLWAVVILLFLSIIAGVIKSPPR
jgi:hypothetical protein